MTLVSTARILGSKVLRVLRDEGSQELLSRARWYAQPEHLAELIAAYQSRDIAHELAAFRLPDRRPEAVDAEPRSIGWIIPDFYQGAGGHLSALRMSMQLQQLGWRSQYIAIDPPHRWSNASVARARLREAFVAADAEVVLDPAELPPLDLLFATSWQTAYSALHVPARHRLYFVQDYEPAFFAQGSEYHLAEQTYRFGFTAITAGNWLADVLREQFGLTTMPFGFSIDRDLYNPQPQDAVGRRSARQGPGAGRRRVAFYARPSTPRRMFEVGVLALARLSEAVPDVEVVLLGGDVANQHLPFAHSSLGRMRREQLPEVYRSCDAALVLSATNVSLLPLEIMACGCPVVSNRGPHVEWLLPETATCLTDPYPEAIARGLQQVLTDPVYAEQLVTSGLELAASTDWMREAERVSGYLDTIASREPDAAPARAQARSRRR